MGTELAQFFKFPAKHFSLEIPPKRVNRIAPRGFVSKPTNNYTKGIFAEARATTTHRSCPRIAGALSPPHANECAFYLATELY